MYVLFCLGIIQITNKLLIYIGLNRYNNQPVSNPKNNVILTRNRMLSIYVMVGALD